MKTDEYKGFSGFLLWVLTKVVDLITYLNYILGDQRYQRNADGVIEWTPLWMNQLYFHRCTLRSCGCGYDGCYIHPSQCPRLAEDLRTGTYRGY